MIHSTEMYTKIRQSFLSSLKDVQPETELLQQLLIELETNRPELLVKYEPEGNSDDIVDDELNWNEKYYSQQMLLAEHNFSHRRLKHLIDVRDYFRQQGIRGFVPKMARTAQPLAEKTGPVLSAFIPSENLKKFVTEGDLLTIRTALRVELDDNRIATDALRASLIWTKNQVPGLCENYTEKAFARAIELDRSRWTPDYYYGQIAYLKANFSEKRYQHLVDVRDLLCKDKVEGFVAIAPKAKSATTQASSVASPAKYQDRQSQHYTSSASSNSKHQQGQSQHDKSSGSGHERNPYFKTALMIGGAIAALVVYLLAMVK